MCLACGRSVLCASMAAEEHSYVNWAQYDGHILLTVAVLVLSCAGEARSSVLSFWHSFVEPFFGRGQRQYSPLHTKTEMQQLEAEEHMEKQSSSSEEPEEPKGERLGVCS